VGVPLRFEAETRKWFPASNRSRDVRDALVARATHLGVAFRFGTTLLDLRPSPSGWHAETTQGPIGAARVVLATGGLSVPSTGSAGAGLRIAAALGHVVHETYPALTPLLAAPHPHAHLSGVSVSARVRAESPRDRADATGGLLITHRGYSGPAVLDVSHVATRRAAAGGRAVVRVRWSDLGAAEWQEACAGGGATLVATVVARHLPRRLADALVAEAGIDPGCRLAELRRDARARLIERLVSSELPWTGDEGYRKAEVTGGGVALDEVDPRTLESRRHPVLFLCGELLDAFGPIGGHNFAWAWATGRAAGLAAAAA
jgi:predicted Rossmann fold flavoprotein